MADASALLPIIQVAGIIDLAEAEMVLAAGATHLGFPLRLPDGREDLSERDAALLIAALSKRPGGRERCVLITYETRAREIEAFARALDVGGVQLHAPIVPAELAALRRNAPDLLLIKSLVVGAQTQEALEWEAEAASPHVDAFITDSFDPATGRRGATGLVHDWAASRALVDRLERPVILAGGLTPANVADAVAAVGPGGVDAHTGLEDAAGRKDPALVAAFVSRAREALRSNADDPAPRSAP